jgi:hypothetical protein
MPEGEDPPDVLELLYETYGYFRESRFRCPDRAGGSGEISSVMRSFVTKNRMLSDPLKSRG